MTLEKQFADIDALYSGNEEKVKDVEKHLSNALNDEVSLGKMLYTENGYILSAKDPITSRMESYFTGPDYIKRVVETKSLMPLSPYKID